MYFGFKPLIEEVGISEDWDNKGGQQERERGITQPEHNQRGPFPMQRLSGLGCSKESALSLMPGFDDKCNTTTVDGHFEAQKRTGAVAAENMKTPYCGEQQSLEERCHCRRYSAGDLDISPFQEKKSRRHRMCKYRPPLSIPSDTKRNSLPCMAISMKHSALGKKGSLMLREPENSSVLMTQTLITTPR